MKTTTIRPNILGQVKQAIADGADALLDAEPETILKAYEALGSATLTILAADGSVELADASPVAKAVREERSVWQPSPHSGALPSVLGR